MSQKFRCVGINDDFNHCECCGRTDLKRVMMLVPLDADGNPEGEAAPYGTSCGAKLLGYAYATSKDKTTFRKDMEREAVLSEVERLRKVWNAAVKDAERFTATWILGNNQFGAATITVTLTQGERVEKVVFVHPEYSGHAYAERARLAVALKAVDAVFDKKSPLKYDIQKAFLSNTNVPYEVRGYLRTY